MKITKEHSGICEIRDENYVTFHTTMYF